MNREQHAKGNNSMHRSFSLILAAAIALAAPPAHADERLIGDWHGILSTPAGQITLALSVTHDADGSLAGTVESIEQAPGQTLAVSNLSVESDTVSFRLPQFNASYKGVWNGDASQWEGVFTQGIDIPLIFEKGPPPARETIDGLDGAWRAVVTRNGVNLRLVLNIRTGERGTIATLDSPDQGAMSIPASSLTRDGDAVGFAIPAAGVSFDGVLSEPDVMTGAWALPGEPALVVTFTRDESRDNQRRTERPQHPSPPFPYASEDVTFENRIAGDVTLAGTLSIPEGEGPFPAAILVTGSGPQDRDQTVFGHKPFLVISDHLTRHGIAVLRYDDRGVGGSTGEFGSATSADFADDALAAFEYLRSRPELRPDAIGIIGHSDGGLVGPLAASRNSDVAFVVSLAGPGAALIDVLLAQNRLIGLSQGESPETLDRRESIVRELMTLVSRSSSTKEAREHLVERLTPETLDALRVPTQQRDVIVAYLTQPWMRYLLNYDPADALSRVEAPVLALNGSLDRQIEPKQSLAGIRAALAHNPDVTVRELEGLNHLFQHSETGGIGEYADNTETFAPEALEIMTEWILSRFPGDE